MSLAVEKSEVGSVNSNDISESVNDWEVFESLSINDNGSVIVLCLLVESWVDNFKGANVSLAVDFVWEVSIDDHTIDVARVVGDEGDLAQLGVFILVGSSSRGARSLGSGFFGRFSHI